MSDSRAFLRFTVKSKGKRTELIFNEEDAILFWSSIPLAILSGGYVYYLDDKLPAAATKALHEWTGNSPLVRSSSSDFDFIFGSLLTKVGLPLTRRN